MCPAVQQAWQVRSTDGVWPGYLTLVVHQTYGAGMPSSWLSSPPRFNSSMKHTHPSAPPPNGSSEDILNWRSQRCLLCPGWQAGRLAGAMGLDGWVAICGPAARLGVKAYTRFNIYFLIPEPLPNGSVSFVAF